MSVREHSQAQRLTIAELVGEFSRFRLWIAACVLVPVVLAGGYWYVTPPVYRATAVVEVADRMQDGSGLSGFSLPSSLSGFASLAGISRSSDKEETLAILRSNLMARVFISENELVPVLFANSFDAATGKWKTKDGRAPSMEKAVRRFRRQVLRVELDSATGLIRIDMRSDSPELAARWVNDYVSLANTRMKERALSEAGDKLAYLWKEIDRAQQVELRQAIARLIQVEINNSMLASVSSDYALRVLDPAVAPDSDDYVWPRLGLVVVISALIGLIIGLATAAFWRRRD